MIEGQVGLHPRIPTPEQEKQALRAVSLAQFITFSAIYLLFFASIAFVEGVTQSSAQTGWMVMCFSLPGFVLAMLAGVWVDRTDRRRLMIVGNMFGMAIAMAFIAAAMWMRSMVWVVLFSGNCILSGVIQFSASARDSILPRAVSKRNLFSANSILLVAVLGAQALGAVLLAPILYRVGGIPLAGAAAVVLFGLAVWATARIPPSVGQLQAPVETDVSGLWPELRIGWGFIRQEPSVRGAIFVLVLANAWMLMMAALLPGLATRVWKAPISSATYFAIPGGLGFASGLWLISKWGRRRPAADWIHAGLFTLAIGLFFFPRLGKLEGIETLHFLLLSICVGMSFALLLIPSRSLVQERSPDSIRGRVISTQLFLQNVGAAIPLPLVGGVADKFGFKFVFTGLAVITLAAGVLSIWSARRE